MFASLGLFPVIGMGTIAVSYRVTRKMKANDTAIIMEVLLLLLTAVRLVVVRNHPKFQDDLERYILRSITV